MHLVCSLYLGPIFVFQIYQKLPWMTHVIVKIEAKYICTIILTISLPSIKQQM